MRAPPDMWSKCTTASVVIKALRNRSHSFLMVCINSTLYTTRKKPDFAVLQQLTRKIGLHNPANRLKFMNGLNAWMTNDLNDDAIRTLLKEKLV